LLAELRKTVQEARLLVYAQPKADMRSGVVRTVEALVRWPVAERGFIPPDVFIPLAERSGLIRPLTSYVLSTSLQAVADWQRRGHRIGIAVNLSARSLLDPDLVNEVEQLLRLHRVPAELLTLEITEGSLMSDSPRAIEQLERLHDIGVRLSIDDFGTGYSSLSYLKRLPVDEVKIDRSFVSSLASDDSDAAIVRSVIDLGANLSLHVVAEGVEDADTWSRLVDMGCELAQGYYLGKPMPLDDFPAWLAAYERQGIAGSRVVKAIG
jgi:EAL domain-containing protein (putative c-di-GMP-specific phosphodiesterase class I)